MTYQRLNSLLITMVVTVAFIWLAIPFTMAVLWSLVDPAEPWTADKLLPPVMSFYRWVDMWENSSLRYALISSYTLAPSAALLGLCLALPTAFALGRFDFPGREVAKLLCLLPLVVPPFITAIFFSALLFQLGLNTWRFGAIVFAHSILFLPYAIRILTVSFETVRQDHIDAARDLGASAWARFRVAYFPALKPGISATLLIVFIRLARYSDNTYPFVFCSWARFRSSQCCRAFTHPSRSQCVFNVDFGAAYAICQPCVIVGQRVAGIN